MNLYQITLIVYSLALFFLASRNFYKNEISILGLNLLIQTLPALFVSIWLNESRSIYPAFLAILGVLIVSSIFCLSSLVSTRNIFIDHEDRLLIIARRLMFVGLVLKMAAISINAGGVVSYIQNLNAYDLNVKTAGFLDVGLDFYILGASIYFNLANIRSGKKLFFLISTFAVLFILSTSKASFVGFIFTALYFYRMSLRSKGKPTSFKYFGLGLLLFVFLLSIGIKTQIKYLGLDEVSFDIGKLFEIAVNTIAVRYSGDGLFTGYQNIVDRISLNDSLALNGRAILDTFTQNIPSFLLDNPENKVHAFRGLGYLINTSQIIDPDSNDAPTIFGYCFIDFGIYGYFVVASVGSMIYVFLTRSFLLVKKTPFALALTFFSLKFISNISESGFLNLFYWYILSLFLLVITLLLDLIPVIDTRSILKYSLISRRKGCYHEA